MATTQYLVRMWREDHCEVINCDHVVDVAEWCRRFTTNRLDNDVSNPVHRCVIGTYQLGYLYDYLEIQDKYSRESYFTEGIASALIHLIASYEMTGRIFVNIFKEYKNWDYKWSTYFVNDLNIFMSSSSVLSFLAEHVYKYQRWILYYDMGRKKRWNEKDLNLRIKKIVDLLLILTKNEGCNLASGFQYAMEKLLDQEIKNH